MSPWPNPRVQGCDEDKEVLASPIHLNSNELACMYNKENAVDSPLVNSKGGVPPPDVGAPIVSVKNCTKAVSTGSKYETDSNNSSSSALNSRKGHVELDKRVYFLSFCNMLETIQNRKGHKERIGVLEKFWSSYRHEKLYPFMRLLLPHLDRERLTYGLKESKIAKYYTEILCLPQNCHDALRMKHWKDPSLSSPKKSSTSKEIISFSDTVYSILVNRGWTPHVASSVPNSHQAPSLSLTIYQINQYLDALSSALDNDQKKKVLLKLLNSTTAFEQKWIIRIILKDMRIHIQHQSIFSAFHPHALDLYNACTNLKEVCEKCQDPGFVYSSKHIKTFSAIKPMLASLISPEKLKALLRVSNCVIEPKYDGERIMVHKNGNKIMYFTRNAKDYTNLYGPKFDDIIKNHITGESAIIDGEMLVWDNEIGAFKEFGHNRTFALSDSSNEKEHFCYMIFDLVHLNGGDVTNLPYHKRRKYLEGIIKPLNHVIDIVPSHPVETESDIFEALEVAVLNRDEGIMIKNTESFYIPGERRHNWLKLKPDHIDGMGETVDLIIMGGYYGTKFGRKSISHFLLGISVPPSRENSRPERFYTFCKVGSGYTNTELLALQTTLAPHWKKYSKNEHIPFFSGWDPQSNEVPDVYIEPHKSTILEVKAYQLQETTKFQASYTLRFPRVKRIRHDKDWHECLDLNGLKDLLRYSSRKRKRLVNQPCAMISDRTIKIKQRSHSSNSSFPCNSENSRRKRQDKLMVEHFQDTDTSKVAKISDLFSGKEFVVFNADDSYPKQKIETMIILNGGTKVQNPSHSTHYLIAAHDKNIRVQNWIEACNKKHNPFGDKDVIHYSWMVNSVQERHLLPLHPRYMIYTSEDTKRRFEKEIDAYGDSFREDTDLESLKHQVSVIENKEKITSQVIEQINEDYTIRSCNLFFRGVIAYVDRFKILGNPDSVINGSTLTLIELWMKLYGAHVVTCIPNDPELTKQISHVIIDRKNVSGSRAMKLFELLPEAKIVDLSWVISCKDQKMKLEEKLFMISKRTLAKAMQMRGQEKK